MRFKSRRDSFFTVIFLLSTILLVGITVLIIVERDFNPAILFSIVGLVLVVSINFKTHYEIKEGKLFWQSGFFKGNLKISSIRKLELNQTMWSGNKPALARNGIIIKYNKYDDLYVSPENQTKFIEELLRLNPGIEIKE